MYKCGLILEGGAMRGVYTSGVLDFFLDKEIVLSSVYGVSSGACQAYSYISKQRGRNIKVIKEYIHDKRYLSVSNFIREGGIFGMDFVFNQIPNELQPFDYETYYKSEQDLIIVTTNCITGKPEYFSSKEDFDMYHIGKASSSMPLLAKDVLINGIPHLDGVVGDPIPIKQSMANGNKKNIIVLTRDRYYRKTYPKNVMRLMKIRYPKYRELIKTYDKRHEVYNETLDFIGKLEKQGEAIVIRPQKNVLVTHLEKDLDKLIDLYDEGYNDAKEKYEQMINFLNK